MNKTQLVKHVKKLRDVGYQEGERTGYLVGYERGKRDALDWVNAQARRVGNICDLCAHCTTSMCDKCVYCGEDNEAPEFQLKEPTT